MTDQQQQHVFTAEELKQARLEALAFHIEAARAGLFASAVDMAETMKANNVENIDAIILTASAEFTAQLWQQVGHRRLVPMATCRKNLLGEVTRMFSKYVRRTREGGPAPASVQ